MSSKRMAAIGFMSLVLLAMLSIPFAVFASIGSAISTEISESMEPETTVSKTIGAFTGIRSEGHTNIVWEQDASPTGEYKLSGTEKGVSNTSVTVVDGILIVKTKGSGRSQLHVNSKSLTTVESSGSGNLSLNELAGKSLQVTLNGSGDVELDGSVADFRLVSNGSGDVDSVNLVTETAYLEMHGSGDAEFGQSNSLTAKSFGSGDITYMGEPKTSFETHGSGGIDRD